MDLEVTFQRHIAGDFHRPLGQLCSRCGRVLIRGGDHRFRGYPPAEGVLVSTDTAGRFRCPERDLLDTRDRSDEADCLSIIEDPH